MAHEGGCLCGAVRFSIDAAPLTARRCWCRLCQYLSAGGGTVNVIFPREALHLTGEVRWHEDVADSGNAMQRGFCPTCGTSLLSRTEVRPHLVVVRAGALDDPARMAPQMEIWTEAAPDWAVLNPALPHHPAQNPQ
ncbi:aldehyde-activating protein [Sphingobium amiense]|uniref:Aldehyde-activating protein n=1 Tax=Sphingobium amiense TaxID=135719 RepID=A0A494W4A2_9SPHN|nr:GFA family protein [Sphingobium amiense]BBD97998.1 aldehyde-activating protein [Sphingobium amiense]